MSIYALHLRLFPSETTSTLHIEISRVQVSTPYERYQILMYWCRTVIRSCASVCICGGLHFIATPPYLRGLSRVRLRGFSTPQGRGRANVIAPYSSLDMCACLYVYVTYLRAMYTLVCCGNVVCVAVLYYRSGAACCASVTRDIVLETVIYDFQDSRMDNGTFYICQRDGDASRRYVQFLCDVF